jgi:hypothetical protein
LFALLWLGCPPGDDDDDTTADDDDATADDDDDATADDDDATADDDDTADPQLELFSTAFEDGAAIPVDYTCDGANISPPLGWRNPPENVGSWALFMSDPDANDFAHWAILDIPGDLEGLDEGISPGGALPAGVVELRNGFTQMGYGGCCPPNEHTYEFVLFALEETTMGVGSDVSFVEALPLVAAAALEHATLTGTYGN